MPGLAPPTAVLFDVGDTLLVEERFNLEAGIAAAVGHDGDVRALAEAFRADLLESHRAQRELWLAAWLQQRLPALANESLASLEDRIWPAVVTLSPLPGIENVLSRLAADGVLMAAVSNAAFSGRILAHELGRARLAGYLQFVISSADIGIRKPASEIFRRALRRLDVLAQETWFVGDTLDEDIAGAAIVGLTSFLLSAKPLPNGAPVGCRVVADWAEFYAVYAGTTDPSALGS